MITSRKDPNLQTLLDSDITFSIRKTFSDAWNNFSLNAGKYIGFTLLVILISIAGSFIPIVNMGVSLLTGVLYAGFYIFAHQSLQDGKETKFSFFWKGFGDAGQLIVSSLIQALIIFGIFIVFFLLIGAGIASAIGMENLIDGSTFNLEQWIEDNFQDNPALLVAGGVGVLVFYFALFCLFILWIFSFQFITFYKMNAWDSMECSRKLVMKKFGKIFLFMFASSLVALLGFLCFGIGLIVSFPVVMIAQYFAFKQLVANIEEDGMSNSALENHFVG